MRIGPLISVLSSTYGIPEASVVLVARAMREAGWISTGARGVNAPEMTAADAARLTIALLTGETPGKVVEEFELVRTLQTGDLYPDVGFVSAENLAKDHTFEDAVTALFAATMDADHLRRWGEPYMGNIFGPSYKVVLDSSQRTAEVQTPSLRAFYSDICGQAELDRLYDIWPMTPELGERIDALEARSPMPGSSRIVPGRGMRVVRSVTDREIRKVTDALGGSNTTSNETP